MQRHEIPSRNKRIKGLIAFFTARCSVEVCVSDSSLFAIAIEFHRLQSRISVIVIIELYLLN